MGGSGADAATQAVAQLSDLSEHMKALGETLGSSLNFSDLNLDAALEKLSASFAAGQSDGTDLEPYVASLNKLLTAALAKPEAVEVKQDQSAVALQAIHKVLTKIDKKSFQQNVEVVNQPHPGLDVFLNTIAKALESSIFPLIKVMEGKIDIDLKTNENMREVLADLKLLKDKFNRGGLT